MKKYVLLVVVGLLMVLSYVIYEKKYGYDEALPKLPSPLIDGFQSFQSPDEVAAILTANGFTWEIIEDSKLAPDDRRPKFENLRWKVGGFSHLEQKGELNLDFFNGRLMRTIFYPEDANTYQSIIEKKMGVSIDASKGLQIQPATRLRHSPESSQSIFFDWVDENLELKSSEWIKKFS